MGGVVNSLGSAVGKVGGFLGGSPSSGGWLGGITGKTPAPNFGGLAQQQNNYNTPWSSLQNGNLSLNPQAQQAMSGIQNNMVSAAGMDPAQARNQAVNQNLAYGQQLLGPQFAQQNEAMRSGNLNTGASPQQQAMSATLLGNQQGGMLGGVLNNAINMGNQTQQTQMQQSMLPFQQYGSLIGSSLGRPTQPNLLGAGALQYGAGRDWNAQAQANKSSLGNKIGGSIGGVPGGTFGGSYA